MEQHVSAITAGTAPTSSSGVIVQGSSQRDESIALGNISGLSPLRTPPPIQHQQQQQHSQQQQQHIPLQSPTEGSTITPTTPTTVCSPNQPKTIGRNANGTSK